MTENLERYFCSLRRLATEDSYKNSDSGENAPQKGGQSIDSCLNLLRLKERCQPLTELRMPAQPNLVG
jgi:hypothetical protein